MSTNNNTPPPSTPNEIQMKIDLLAKEIELKNAALDTLREKEDAAYALIERIHTTTDELDQLERQHDILLMTQWANSEPEPEPEKPQIIPAANVIPFELPSQP